MNKLTFFLSLLFSSFFVTAQQIDNTQSKITFSVSNMGVRTVDGSISAMKGNVAFNKESPEHSSFRVTVDVSTINTDNNARDKHLRNEDFFEVETYPTMSFTSTRVREEGNAYKVTGILKIKDVSKQVEIPFSVSEKNNQTILKGDITINRKDYHVGMDTGKFMVGYTIEVAIICVIKQ